MLSFGERKFCVLLRFSMTPLLKKNRDKNKFWCGDVFTTLCSNQGNVCGTRQRFSRSSHKHTKSLFLTSTPPPQCCHSFGCLCCQPVQAPAGRASNGGGPRIRGGEDRVIVSDADLVNLLGSLPERRLGDIVSEAQRRRTEDRAGLTVAGCPP